MTVSSQTNNATFVGNGVTTVFPLPFRFFANGDVFAYFIDSTTGASTPMVLGTDYTLTGAGEPEVDGGALSVLTTTAPLANGRGMYVERILPQTQQTDIVNQGEFFASTHEDVFDRLTMQIQQSTGRNQGAIRVAIGDPEPRRLPPAPQRANLLLGFDSGGNPIVVAPVSGSATDLAVNLANNSDPSKGAALIGYKGRTLAERLGDEVSVKDFGAKGDGVTDDAPYISAALDYVAANRGVNLVFPAGKYLINSPLTLKPAALPPALSGSDIHFSDHVESVIYGSGDARIIAGAVMTAMLTLKFNSATSSIGPFYTAIRGLTFDGADLAHTAIYSDFTVHVRIEKNKIRRVINGIYYIGYGVARIRDNIIKANICINFFGGGGDSCIEGNDFYPQSSGRGVNIAKLAGNTVIEKNIFSGEGNHSIVGVYLDGNSNNVSDEIRNVRIQNNEFSGMNNAIYGQRHSAGRNIYNILISRNHTIPAAGGAVHTGQIAYLVGVDDAIISENFVNGLSLIPTISLAPGVLISDCLRFKIAHNKIGNLLGSAIYIVNSVNGEIVNNEIYDTGSNGDSSVVIDVDTGTTFLACNENTITQSSPSYAQNPIFERDGANANEFLRNRIKGANRPTIVGASSVVAGRTIAQGSYSLSGGVATKQGNSYGFSVNRTGVGVCQVAIPIAQPDADYRVKVTADAPQVAVDTFTTTGFIVRTYNTAGAPSDATRVQLEIIN